MATDNIYIVTELAATDLFNYERSGAGIYEECVQNVAVGLLLALMQLHKHGCCHLDLKPENVLLKAATTSRIAYTDVRLADFGLARMNSRTSSTNEVIVEHTCCGTVGFFAPEMTLHNKSFVGQRADIWSLGCLLYEMVFKFHEEWIEAYSRVEYDPEGFRHGLEECVKQLVADFGHEHDTIVDFLQKCLVIIPSERMAADEALRHPWLENVVKPEMLQD